MRSIVYAGNDFSDVCSAEVVARSANPIIAEYMRVPGRAGALLVSGYIPPVDMTVRLFMDMGYNPGFTGKAPAALVEAERAKLEKNRQMLETLKKRIAELG